MSRLARALLAVLRRIGAEITSRLRHAHVTLFRCPSLSHWLKPLAEAAAHVLRLYFVRGGNRAARRIVQALAKQNRIKWTKCPLDRRPHFSVILKRIGGPLSLARRIFNAIHSFVGQAIERLALDFAQSTLVTLALDVNDAAGAIREELLEGLGEGEGLRELARRVRRIFTDPERAELIARTESQRAMYAGEVMAARQSGVVVGHKWLAAPACCPVCCGIDGKVVRLGEPFLTGMGRNPNYSTVYHPPAHPACRCALTAVIDPKYLR